MAYEIEQGEVLNAIIQLGIPYKESGDEIKLEYCPFCEVGVNIGNKNHYKHFSINSVTGRYNCWHKNSCGEMGGWYSFKDKMGLTPMGGDKRSYLKPQENELVTTPEDKFYQWYEKERGIKKDVLEIYQVSSMKQHNKSFIVYKYFDEDGNEINRKYRNAQNKKEMWTEKGCEQIFYGIKQYPNDLDRILIVEGEDDVHAMASYGLRAVSVPFGAGAISPSMLDYCNNFEYIYLIFDNDTAGDSGAKRLAEKLGLGKCLRVRLPEKDARECLLRGVTRDEIVECVGNGKRFEHDSIGSVSDSDFADMWNTINGSHESGGLYTKHKYFNYLTRGIRYGELTVITGHTGCGKTTFADNILQWIEDLGYPVMPFHFENSPLDIKCNLVEIKNNKAYSEWDNEKGRIKPLVNEHEYREAFNELKYSNWYIFQEQSEDGYYELSKLKEVILYANTFYGIYHFAIDHLHYFLKTSNSNNATAIIDEAVRELREFAKNLNIHIFLMVHPSKVGQSKDGTPNKVGIESSKGSSSIGQIADNFWVIDKVADGYSSASLKKHRKFGNTGTIYFKVEHNYNCFTECYKENPVDNSFDPNEDGFGED